MAESLSLTNLRDYGASSDGNRYSYIMAPRTNAGEAETLMVKCRGRKGGSSEYAVLDLSAGGCMVRGNGLSSTQGERVLLTLPGLAAQPGHVVWVEDGKAGIAFEHPLYEAVLTGLQDKMDALAA